MRRLIVWYIEGFRDPCWWVCVVGVLVALRLLWLMPALIDFTLSEHNPAHRMWCPPSWHEPGCDN